MEGTKGPVTLTTELPQRWGLIGSDLLSFISMHSISMEINQRASAIAFYMTLTGKAASQDSLAEAFSFWVTNGWGRGGLRLAH